MFLVGTYNDNKGFPLEVLGNKTNQCLCCLFAEVIMEEK